MKRIVTGFLLVLFAFAVSANAQVISSIHHPELKSNSTRVAAGNQAGTISIPPPSGYQVQGTQIDSVSYFPDTANGNAWVYVPVLDQSTGDSLGYYGVSQNGLFYYQNEDTIGPLGLTLSTGIDTTLTNDTMYSRVMGMRITTPTDISSPKLIGADLTIFPISFNPADNLEFWVVPIVDAKFGNGNYYPIPELFGTQLASATVAGSTIVTGQVNNIHVTFNKVLYSGKKVLYPEFGILVFVNGPNFATDTVGYVLESDPNTTIPGNLTIDTDGTKSGSTGIADVDGNPIPMRTYQENLDAGNQNIGGVVQSIGGGGGFFFNFAELNTTDGTQTGLSFDGNLLLTTEFSGANSGVTPDAANEYSLDGNYPNPVSTTTDINYDLGANGPVTLEVYNVLGQNMGTLVNGVQGAGEHTATFNVGTLPDGMYYYKLQSGEFSATNSMVIAR